MGEAAVSNVHVFYGVTVVFLGDRRYEKMTIVYIDPNFLCRLFVLINFVIGVVKHEAFFHHQGSIHPEISVIRGFDHLT